MNVEFNLSELGNIILTVAAVLGALAILLRFVRGPILNWLGIQTTPNDVYEKVEEVHVGVSFLVGIALADAEPTQEEIQEALEVLQRANIVSDNGD